MPVHSRPAPPAYQWSPKASRIAEIAVASATNSSMGDSLIAFHQHNFSFFCHSLFLHFFTIHGDTTVWADDATRGTAHAGFLIDSLHIGITVQIHFVGQGDDLLRAGDDAKAASLTPLSIHLDGALNL